MTSPARWLVRVALGSAAVACGARTGMQVDELASDAGRDAGAQDAGRDALLDSAPFRDVANDVPSTGCTISIDATVSTSLVISTDDEYILFVNDQLIDQAPHPWTNPQTYALQIHRHPSRFNVIAVKGTNVANIGGRDRGIIADLSFTAESGAQHVVTNQTWRLSLSEVPNWAASSFDASAWRFATVEGPAGIGPWGAILGKSKADWIWSYDSNLPSGAKPEAESVFVRRNFFIGVEGKVRDDAGACP